MERDRRSARALALLALLVFLAGCATAPAPAPQRTRPASLPSVHSTGHGPAKGFTTTQELTSLAEILWEGRLPGRGEIKEKRETGLRILATFEVAERGENTALIRVRMQKTDILRGGRFSPAFFQSLNSPQTITFKVNYGMRTVDFTAAERSWSAWAEDLKKSHVVLTENFSVRAYIAQLKDLFGRTALDFAGNTYSFGRKVSEKREFFVPLTGPGISLGPLDVDLDSSLRYVEVAGGRKIFRIKGEQHSRFLRMNAASLAARLHALGVQAPPAFESEGTLSGTVEAQVDADSGWTKEIYADFTAVITTGFAGGSLTETVKGMRIAAPR